MHSIMATEPLNPQEVAACTCANLRMATRVVTQIFDTALRPAGLKVTQFTLLAKIHRSGTLPVSQLADFVVMDRTTLTRNLKPLVSNGWVTVEQGSDQRERLVSLTELGEQTLDAARPHWAIAQEQVVDALGLDRWSGLIGDLREATIATKG
jgi:DNA-binding MarR family transcriptional regulator